MQETWNDCWVNVAEALLDLDSARKLPILLDPKFWKRVDWKGMANFLNYRYAIQCILLVYKKPVFEMSGLWIVWFMQHPVYELSLYAMSQCRISLLRKSFVDVFSSPSGRLELELYSRRYRNCQAMKNTSRLFCNTPVLDNSSRQLCIFKIMDKNSSHHCDC